MIVEQRLDEIRSYIKKLEADLAEVDAMVSEFYARMPNCGTVHKAMRRHHERESASVPAF